ncbi:zinc-ribbon domain-containing protein [Coprobacillaceae bacterium CR2/5/TPMF4]|nr:zinc-ribbon domain-containing protein [Coprobacillaceae bacterium CR2/5/TPMF4]
MFCINCGKQIPDDATFCPKCGTKIFVESTNQSNTTYTNNQKTNNKVNLNEPFKWHAGAIIWFIILIIICLYTIFFHLQLNALLNIDELSLNINAFYPINQVISLTIATLQILSIIFLLVKGFAFVSIHFSF